MRAWLPLLVAAAVAVAGCGASSKHTSSTTTGTSPAADEAQLVAGGIPKIVGPYSRRW